MKFHFRYVYTYFHFDDILNEGAYDETFDATAGNRFTLTHQEDGSFLVGGVGHDAGGEYAILTFPNKGVDGLPAGALSFSPVAKIIWSSFRKRFRRTVRRPLRRR